MTTAFLQQRDALHTLLTQAPAVAGGNVSLSATAPVVREHSQAVHLRLLRSDGVRNMSLTGRTRWETQLAIDCIVRHSVTDEAVAQVDALLAQVYARLATVGAHAGLFGGAVALMPEPQVAWDFEEAASGVVAATLAVTVRHTTQGQSLVP